MATSRNNRFSKGCNCRSLLVAAAILCGAYSAQAALPSGYTELQYFSMSGNGAANNSTEPLKFWLDTGASIDHDSTLEIAFAYDKHANTSYQSCIFWSKKGDGMETAFWVYTPSRSYHALADVNNAYYELSYVLAEGEKHVFKLSNGVLYIDGSLWKVDRATGSFGSNLVLFGSYYQRSDTVPTSRGYDGKFYYARLLNGSFSEVMNLVPARRDSDGVVGAYDTVAGRFLVNAGSGGSFTAGPAKADEQEGMAVVSVLKGGSRSEPVYSPVVRCGGAKLKAGQDYTFAVTTNDAGTATMSVTGIGTYAGETAEAKFQVVVDPASGYVELEYLRSSLVQANVMPYIDTGFVPDRNTRVDFSFTAHPHVSQAFAPFGKSTSDHKNKFQVIGLYGSNARNTWETDYGKGDRKNLAAGAPYGPGRHLFSLDKNVFTLDGYTATYDEESDFVKDSITAYVFAEHHGDEAIYPTPMDLYWMKIWDDGDLVRNYIAVSNTATGAVGLYDTVNSVFYGNANASSANFIAGPALLVPEPAENGFIIFVR